MEVVSDVGVDLGHGCAFPRCARRTGWRFAAPPSVIAHFLFEPTRTSKRSKAFRIAEGSLDFGFVKSEDAALVTRWVEYAVLQPAHRGDALTEAPRDLSAGQSAHSKSVRHPTRVEAGVGTGRLQNRGAKQVASASHDRLCHGNRWQLIAIGERTRLFMTAAKALQRKEVEKVTAALRSALREESPGVDEQLFDYRPALRKPT